MTNTEPRYAIVYQTPPGGRVQGGWCYQWEMDPVTFGAPDGWCTPLYRIKCVLRAND